MDSSTFGLPKNSRLGYRETINYATRISIDGIYMHQLDATVWAQGNRGDYLSEGDGAWFWSSKTQPKHQRRNRRIKQTIG